MSFKVKVLLVTLISLGAVILVTFLIGRAFLQTGQNVRTAFEEYRLAVEALDKLGELQTKVALFLSNAAKIEEVSTLFNELKKVADKIPSLKANMDALQQNISEIISGRTEAVSRMQNFVDQVKKDIMLNLDRTRENLDREILHSSELSRNLVFLVLPVVAAASVVFLFMMVSRSLRFLKPVMDASRSLRNNDLTITIQEVKGKDEISTLLNEFKASIEYLRNNLRDVQKEAISVAESIEDVSRSEVQICDLSGIIMGKGSSVNPNVSPGDVIYVPSSPAAQLSDVLPIVRDVLSIIVTSKNL